MNSRGFSVLVDTASYDLYGAQSLPVTTQAHLQRHPDIVERFLSALVEATAFSVAPRNRPIVLGTIMRAFNLADIAASSGSSMKAA